MSLTFLTKKKHTQEEQPQTPTTTLQTQQPAKHEETESDSLQKLLRILICLFFAQCNSSTQMPNRSVRHLNTSFQILHAKEHSKTTPINRSIYSWRVKQFKLMPKNNDVTPYTLLNLENELSISSEIERISFPFTRVQLVKTCMKYDL